MNTWALGRWSRVGLVVVVSVAALAYIVWPSRSASGDDSPARTIARPGTSRAELEQTVSTMRARLAERQDDGAAAVRLAEALVRLARATGRPRLVDEAEVALRRIVRNDPGRLDARRSLAGLYLSQHRFREAIDEAERVCQVRPTDAWSLGVIGDGHAELGDYDRAFDAFQKMADVEPGAAAYARVSYARELQGDLDGALALMTMAAEATPASDAESLAWHHAQVGSLQLALGRTNDAEDAFARARHAFHDHPMAIEGLARVAAARGEWTRAHALAARAWEIAPTGDIALLIGEALSKLGRQSEAEQQFRLAESIWRIDAPEPARLARLLADRGRADEALAVAERAAAERRDIFTMDALAWAALHARRLDRAARAIAEARRTGTRDPAILAYAEAIDTAVAQARSAS
jgi:tetratricopeptide (TPR) repeat protein